MGSRRSERGLGEVQGRRPVKKRGDFFPCLGAAVLVSDGMGEPFVFRGAEGADAAGGWRGRG